jgi:hypothetical protein
MRILVTTLLAATTLAAAAQLSINIPGTNRPGPSDITVDNNKETRTIPCTNNTVFVRGNDNDLTLTGTCAAVHILGNGNQLVIDRSAKIITEGNSNTVNYRWPNAGVSTTGRDNHIKVVQ